MVRTVRLMLTLAVGALIGALLIGGMGAGASVGMSDPAPQRAAGSSNPDDQTAQPDTQYAKRDDQAIELVAADDDDDDDSASGNTRTRTRSNSRDNTNSRHTRVSRDRDHSRGDLTRDWTKDGPGKSTRDHSRHQTGDGSRHDTR